MSSYTPPQIGSVVRFTVEGVVNGANDDVVSFENGVEIVASSYPLNHASIAPSLSFEVIAESPKNGAVGIHYDSLSKRSVVLYRATSTDRETAGWYTAFGTRVNAAQVRPISSEQFHDLLFSQDEVKLPSDKAADLCGND